MNTDVIKQILETSVPFIQRTGLKAIDLSRGACKLMMPFADNGNHIGIMYAGALFTLAEAPAGAIFLTTFDVSRFYPTLKDQYIRYRRPAKTDVICQAGLDDAEIERIIKEAEAEGKAEFIIEATLTDAQGEVVAESKQTCQIRRHGM
jgi:acyl-coenzyme A thioesterase PaaI-like protein